MQVSNLKVRVAFGSVVCLIAVALAPLGFRGAAAQSSSFANFEGSPTNPIRMSADGTRLYVANTPNNSLSVFDITTPGAPVLLSEIPVGLVPVSVNPLTDDVVWVVNQLSGTISVVSVSQGLVTNTIYAGTEPMDVVFAGNLAYVSISRTNQIATFNVNTLAPVNTIPLFGGSPRALAVSPNGSKVYVAMAISGNATTIIPANLAPPQIIPPACTTTTPANNLNCFNTALPTPPQVGLIVSANDPNWTSDLKYKMPDNDVAVINTTGATPTLQGYFSGVGTINFNLAVNPVTGDVYVANTDALNLTQYTTNIDGHFVNNRVTVIQKATGAVVPYDLNPAINYSILPNPASLSIALATPTAIAVDPSGNFMWVAAFGTDRVAQVNTLGNVLSRIEIDPNATGSTVNPAGKRGPRGLALNAPAGVLYVFNRISDSLSVVNTTTQAVTSEIAAGTNPTPASIASGRGFLYDAKLSGSGTGSCASCHVDGDTDHIAWNLGTPSGAMETVIQGTSSFQMHPMKGPMTTQTLKGLQGLAPYHWRGDHVNLAAFNGAFSAFMGGPSLTSSNMNLLDTFEASMLYMPNPNLNLDGSFPASMNIPDSTTGSPSAGASDYLNLKLTLIGSQTHTCNGCHTAINGAPGTNLQINPVEGAMQPQPLKVPQLRNVYQFQLRNAQGYTGGVEAAIDGFGLNHDGSASGLVGFFTSQIFAAYSPQNILDLSAYLLCFPTGTAPAVGYTITMNSTNVSNSPVQSNWATLQSQAAAGNADLIANGTVNGVLSGLLYQPSSQNYVSNTASTYTQAQLQTLIQNGDTLSFMGVYPGTGAAMVNGLRKQPLANDRFRRLRELLARL